MKRILLTGANGFLGKSLKEEYNNKYEFIDVSRESDIDILDLDALMKVDCIDVVIHLAAKTFIPDSFSNPYSFYNFNLNSTLNIAEFVRKKEIKKIIYLNSYTYGKPKYLPIDENHTVSFHSPYNKSKYLGEELLFKYLENICNVVSFRLFNIYGKNQNQNFLIPTIIKQALYDKKIIVKDLKPKRDYLYIKDLIDLIDLAIEKEDSSGIFNVGSSKSSSVKEVIDNVLDIMGSNKAIFSEDMVRENEVLDCYANIEKVKEYFNWEPKYNLHDGLKNYILETKNV